MLKVERALKGSVLDKLDTFLKLKKRIILDKMALYEKLHEKMTIKLAEIIDIVGPIKEVSSILARRKGDYILYKTGSMTEEDEDKSYTKVEIALIGKQISDHLISKIKALSSLNIRINAHKITKDDRDNKKFKAYALIYGEE